MTDAPLPPPLHPRLTVVRADADALDLARRLAVTLAGLGALDLRARPDAVVDATTIEAEATARAAGALQERVAARDRAVAHRAGLAARRTHLLEQAEWCQDAAGQARALLAALEAAEEGVAAAQQAVDAAGARRQRVAEQRAAAQAAVEEAQLELESLDGATLDESGVRRELEAATRTEQQAIAEQVEAEHALEVLQRRLGDLRAVEAELTATIAQLDADAASLPDPAAVAGLRQALAAYDDLAELAGPDPEAASLAEQLRSVEADLARLRRELPEPPTDDVLAAAEHDVAAARRQVDAARAAAASFDGPPPEWWVELTALHAALVDAEAAVGSGLRKGASRRRYEEALAAERARLDELGFGSYLDALTSGGRLPRERAEDEARVAAATTSLTAAEQRLDALRRDLLLGAPLIERITEQERLLRLAGEFLGADGGDLGDDVAALAGVLERHRAVPVAALDDLADALAAAGLPVPDEGHALAPAARAWLAANGDRHDPARRDTLACRLAEIVGERHTVESALGPASAVAERAAASAVAAARTVAGLEAELRARAGDDSRLLERAVAARELRDQVAAVEARLAAADTEALEAWAQAAEALAAAEAERDRLAQDVAALGRRATRAAAELPPERRPPVDLLTGLAPLAGALRADATALADELAEAEAAVGAAEREVADGEPTPGDRADALRAVLAAGNDAGPVVLAEPFVAAAAVEPTLDVLLELAGQRPVVLVSTDLTVVGWAIGLPAEVGALVPGRSLDALLPAPGVPGSTVETPGVTGTLDATVSARPTAD